jgi:flavin reductase (DIM6/NTAB) family NADH-FMN oxidoreductase RutF
MVLSHDIDHFPDLVGTPLLATGGSMCKPVAAPLFRDAMCRLGAAVHVVTTDGPGGKAGFTATAVCSVSDDPATLLVCLNRRSENNAIFERNGTLCVNALNADETEVAETFAGRTGRVRGERFVAGRWTVLKSGSPVLTSAVVALDCQIVEIKTVATHNIFFAVVEAIRYGPIGQALLYHDRAYKRI